jgi:hypothetical protein
MGGGDIWLTKQGYVLDVHQVSGQSLKGQVVRVSFSGGNAAYADAQQLPGKMNYFVGNQSANWATNVPRFAGTTAQKMLPGLDVRYYFDQGSPRYDLILASGADPSSIAMNFEGANGLTVLPSGNLQIDTSLGPIEERGLVAYQLQGSNRVAVPCQMVVTGSTVHFKLAAYDESKPLVIDPLVFCTYWYVTDQFAKALGPEAVCADASGSIITVGTTTSKTYPTTTGAYQTTNISTYGAGYVAKLSSDGKTLIFGSYLSGTGANAANVRGDAIAAVITDAQGNIYMTGRTGASDFPVTLGAYQTNNAAASSGAANAFVAKLGPDGSQLLFSTYLGGKTFPFQPPSKDFGTGIALDSKGNVVLAGHANSTDFPVTTGVVGDPNDQGRCYVAKLNPKGTTLLFSTLVSGCGPTYILDGQPSLPEVKVDSADNIVIGGFASSSFFAPTPGPWNVALGMGFVEKLSSDGKTKIFATLLAGKVTSIDITPGDGIAFSANIDTAQLLWPAKYDTAGSYHWPAAPGKGACLGQFSSDGTKLVHGALLSDIPPNIRVDRAGNIYLFGDNLGEDYPTTPDAFQKTGGDFYFAELSPAQDKLLYGTHFGGFNPSLSVSANTFTTVTINRVALVGDNSSASDGIPVTTGAYDTSNGPQFLAVLTLPVYTFVEVTPNPVVGGQTVTGKVSIPGPAPVGGYVIKVSSNDSGVKVPASVTIPAGAFSQTFSIPTVGVNSNATATISATFAGGTGTAQLVRIPAALSSLTVTPNPIIEGQTATGVAMLTGQSGPTTDVVLLSSSNPNVTVPSSVSVFYGSVQGVFQVKTATASASYTSVITAKLGSITKTVQVEVDPGLASVSVSPASVVAGAVAQGMVTMSGHVGSAGAVISLSSSSTAATVPASVTVPSGASVATFNITTAGVNAAANVTITAKEGSLVQTHAFTIQPAVFSFLTLNPASVKGGVGVQGIARLNGVAGPAGVTVTISSDSTTATVPASVTIPGGASYTVFVIGTKPVTKTITVHIKGSSGAVITAPLTVNP